LGHELEEIGRRCAIGQAEVGSEVVFQIGFGPAPVRAVNCNGLAPQDHVVDKLGIVIPNRDLVPDTPCDSVAKQGAAAVIVAVKTIDERPACLAIGCKTQEDDSCQ